MAIVSQDRQVKVISFILIIVLIGGVYIGWKFGPHYYQNYAVVAIVDGGAKHLALRGYIPGERDKTVKKMISDLKKQGFDFEENDFIILDDPMQITITLDYEVEIEHPFIDDVSVISFHVSKTAKKKEK